MTTEPASERFKTYYETAVSHFKWECVRLAMKDLSWKWVSAKEDPTGVPTISEMKRCCHDLFLSACKQTPNNDIRYCCTGGFEVLIDTTEEKPLVTIRFILEFSDSDWY